MPYASVLAGDANGMFKMCLDKKTLMPVYGHVNPALEMLMYYPKAAEGNMEVMHGIPVRGSVSADIVGATAVASTSVVAAAVGCSSSSSCCSAAAGESTAPDKPAGAAEATPEPVDAVKTATDKTAAAGCSGEGKKFDKPADKKPKQHKKHKPAQETQSSTADEPEVVPWLARAMGAGRLLPTATWLLTQVILILLGGFYWCIDRPLLGYPSKIIGGIISTAGAAVWFTGYKQQQQCTQALGIGGRGRGSFMRALRRQHKATTSSRSTVKVSMLSALRQAMAVLSARTVLLIMLCLFSTLGSAVAMQVNGMTATAGGVGLLPTNIPLSNGLNPEHNMHLLQHELANLHVSRFRCYSRA